MEPIKGVKVRLKLDLYLYQINTYIHLMFGLMMTITKMGYSIYWIRINTKQKLSTTDLDLTRRMTSRTYLVGDVTPWACSMGWIGGGGNWNTQGMSQILKEMSKHYKCKKDNQSCGIFPFLHVFKDNTVVTDIIW